MGTVVHRHFSSLKDHWHLSFQVMAAPFLPAFSPDVNLCRGLAICMNLGINWQ